MLLKRALTNSTRLMKGNTEQRECYSIMTLLRAATRLTNVKALKRSVSSMNVKALKRSVSSMKGNLIIPSLVCSVLTGCYQQPQLITKKVYIPTKCIATIPPPPHLPSDVVKGVILLQRSYLELRLLLTECACSSAQCIGDQDAKK